MSINKQKEILKFKELPLLLLENKKIREWIKFGVWIAILIFLLTILGVCFIHEPSHYVSGKLFGCQNLTLKCPASVGQGDINYVEGWESCSDSIVIEKDGSRICNLKTTFVNGAGLVFSLLLIIPLFLLFNYYLKKRFVFGKFYLKGKFLIFGLLTLIIWGIKSSAYDIFKIMECYFNITFATQSLNIILALPNIYLIILLGLFLIDFIYLLCNVVKEDKNE